MRWLALALTLLASPVTAQRCPITINGLCVGPDGTPYATQAMATATATVDPSIVVAPSTGNTIALDGSASLLIVNSAQALATLNVVLPPSPRDGQRVVITTTNTITLLSVTASTPIKGGVATLVANGWARFAYSAAVGAWVRTG